MRGPYELDEVGLTFWQEIFPSAFFNLRTVLVIKKFTLQLLLFSHLVDI